MAVYRYMNFDLMGLIDKGIGLMQRGRTISGFIPQGLKDAVSKDAAPWIQKAKEIGGGFMNKARAVGGGVLDKAKNFIGKFTNGGQQPAQGQEGAPQTAQDGTVTAPPQQQASAPQPQNTPSAPQTTANGTVTAPPAQATTPAPKQQAQPKPQVQTTAPRPQTQPKPQTQQPPKFGQAQNQSKPNYSTITQIVSAVRNGSQQAIQKAHSMFPETRGMTNPQQLAQVLQQKATAMKRV